MQLDNVKHCIEDYGIEMIAIFVTALKNQGSRHLLNQFDSKLVEALDTITLTITAPEATFYASEGRSSGKYPPVQSIRDYVKDRNIQYRDKLGRYITDNATAFLISRKLATLGTRLHASHFLAKWQITEEFKNNAMHAYILDTAAEIQKMIDKFEAEQV